MLARKADLDLLETVVRQAGAIARRYVSGENSHHAKKDGSPVSAADLAVNAFLREHLRSARPDYGWLSEEDPDDPARLAAKRVFVVDPIDGTSALLRREPEFTICVGIAEEHRSVAGAVYNPLTEEFFLAAEGLGATLNGKPIHVSGRTELAGARVLVAPGVTGWKVWRGTPWPVMHEEQRCSSAYRLALTAAGLFDATLAIGRKFDWDIAAADIIVREAGGEIFTCNGKIPAYNREKVVISSALAAPPVLMKQILSRTTGVSHL